MEKHLCPSGRQNYSFVEFFSAEGEQRRSLIKFMYTQECFNSWGKGQMVGTKGLHCKAAVTPAGGAR